MRLISTTSKNPLIGTVRCLLAVVAVTLLSACPVSSTAISDADLIAEFLVQNDNGLTSATATFGASDLAGYNRVDLVAGESIAYRPNVLGNRQKTELRKISDGEYRVRLPRDAAAGWYSFALLRLSEDREENDREISNNHAYLPGPFQLFQVDTMQSGPALIVNWLVDSPPPSIDGFTTVISEESFNAIGTCQLGSDLLDVVITEGQIAQQNGMSSLQIPVAEHLQQVLGLSTGAIATANCDFDVQLVRTVNGIADFSLNNKSSAKGQVLKNVAIQWMGQ